MFKPTAHLENQLILPDAFFLPFGGKLDEENRWVQLAQLVPWAEAEKRYGQFFKDTFRGQETLSLRMGLGALIIQERMQLTDRETLASISENPYMQYFIGLPGLKEPFHHSMMTHFRKRLADVLAELNEIVATTGAKEDKNDDNDSNNGSRSSGGKVKRSKKRSPATEVEQQTMFMEQQADSSEANPPCQQTASVAAFHAVNAPISEVQSVSVELEAPVLPNQGTVLMDATCAPADVAYPTDLNLLNEAREKLEAIIDTLHEPVIGQTAKPRTYREKARKQYLAVSKQRKPGAKVIRKAIRRQLSYVHRNLTIIAEQVKTQPLTLLNRKAYRDLLVIHELYRVEFGAKIAVSMVNGYAFLDRLSWDNFNESTTLIDVIEKYRERMGCYPAVVQADQIYRTRENRSFCKQHGIRLSGPALGRKPKKGPTSEEKQVVKQDTGERNAIEGKFGEGKRKYGLDCIRARLAKTSESVIILQLLVMNLERRLRVLFCLIFAFLLRRRPTLIFS